MFFPDLNLTDLINERAYEMTTLPQCSPAFRAGCLLTPRNLLQCMPALSDLD